MTYIRAPSTKRPVTAAPTAMPIFAPVLRPGGDDVYAAVEDAEAGDTRAEAAGVVLELAAVVVTDDAPVGE